MAETDHPVSGSQPADADWSPGAYRAFRKAWADPSLTLRAIARRFDVSPPTARRIAVRLGLSERGHRGGPLLIEQRWNSETKAAFTEAWRTGEPSAEMAKRFGISPNTVPTVAERMGLRRRKPGTDQTSNRRYDKPDPEPRYSDQAKDRNCLKCGAAFRSEHYGERVCEGCKSSSSWRTGADYDLPVRVAT